MSETKFHTHTEPQAVNAVKTAMGKEGEADHMSQAVCLEEKKLLHAWRLIRMNRLNEGAVWQVDLLLGDDYEISNYTRAFMN
jgi:hypothetical protein